ncbi:hydroxyproline-rich glycoprotein family protein [Trifolium repens]|nr:hydroxyproline-rich glycoprotein family protein [Trifolium repens]
MSCALKVDTNCKGWSDTITKILKKIKGLSYSFDQKEGMVYIQGKSDSQKIMRMIARHEKKVELCWMNSVEGNNYAPNNYGPMNMHMTSYSQYQRGYYPPPHSSMPYYYDPMYSSQHGYNAPQYGYPLQPPYY